MKQYDIIKEIEEARKSRQAAYPPGTREILVRIIEARGGERTDNGQVFNLSFRADNGEVFKESLLLSRDLPRLEALKWAVGWWVPGLIREKIGILLNSDNEIQKYIPPILIDPLAVNLFPFSLLRPGRSGNSRQAQSAIKCLSAILGQSRGLGGILKREGTVSMLEGEQGAENGPGLPRKD